MSSDSAATATPATDCSLKFCPNCCNYLYLQYVEAKLEKYCHNCGFAVPCDTFFETSGTPIAVNTINLKHDLTFMRTRAIPCPNRCNGETLYLKKKSQEQHLLCVCCVCESQFNYMSGMDEDADEEDADEEADEDAEEDDEDEDEEENF